jgi:hypothetical protein
MAKGLKTFAERKPREERDPNKLLEKAPDSLLGLFLCTHCILKKCIHRYIKCL